MAVEASQLLARVGSDTSQAQSDLRRFGDAVNTAGTEAVQSAARVERLSQSINLQERELQQLKQRHDQAVASNGLFDSTTQQLQLRIDKLTAAIANNETALQIEQRRLKDLTDTTDDAGKKFNLFGNIVTGAARRLGELGIDAAVDGFRRLGAVVTDFVQTGIESYGVNERITQSYQSLVAVELQRANSTLTQAQALEQASGKAEELVQWNQQLAINSPFSEEEAAKATRLALAYGFNTENAQQLVQVLTDTTAAMGGTGDMMERTARALGQIEARGKTSAQEFNQLSEAGINARQILADAFNVPLANIDKMNEAGQLTADKVIPAIVGRLEQDFGGAAARQSQTVQGLANSLQDLYAIAARDVLGPAIEAVKPAVQELVQTLQDPKTKAELHELGTELGGLARDVLPGLVQTGRDFLGVIQPTFEFVQTYGIPAVAGLGVAYTATLVPGILSATQGFQAQALAVAAANAPLVLIAASIAGVTLAYQNLSSEEERRAGQLTQNVAGYAASNEALAAYNALSDEQRAKLGPLAQEIEAQQQRMQEFAQEGIQATNTLLGTDEAAATRTREGLRAQGVTLQALTQELRDQTNAAGASTSQYALYAQQQQATTEATQELADATAQLTDKQRDQLVQQLQQKNEKADDTRDQLADAENTYNQAQQQRITDHNQKIRDIERTADTERLTAQAQFQAGSEAATADYTARLADIDQAFVQRRVEADYDAGQRRLESESTLNDALADAAQKHADQIEQYNQQRETNEQAFQQRVGELQRTDGERQASDALQLTQRLGEIETQRTAVLTQANADRLAENAQYLTAQSGLTDAYNAKEIAAEDKLTDQRQQAQHAYQDKLRDFNQQTLDAADSYNDARLERETALRDKIVDVQESLQNKISDLRQRATFNAQDARVDYGDDREDREQSHNDKLLDLQRNLTRESNAQAQLRIQQQITAEQERYAEADARAERDFQRKQERAARDLRRAEEQAQLEAQRAEEQARQESERAAARAQREYDDTTAALARKREVIESDYQFAVNRINEQGEHERQARANVYQQDLVELNTKHTAELQAIDTKETAELGKLEAHAQKERDDYTQRETDAQAHYVRAYNDLVTAYAQQGQALDTKFAQEKEKTDRAVQDAETAFAERERKAKESYDHDLTNQQQALEQQRVEATQAYDAKRQDLETKLGEQLASIRTHHDDALKAEKEGFDKQFEQAQTAYAAKRNQLQQSLAEELYAIAQQQRDISRIHGAEAARRIGIDALAAGRDANAAVQGFAQNVINLQIDGNLIQQSDLGDYLTTILSDRNTRNAGTLYQGGPQ